MTTSTEIIESGIDIPRRYFAAGAILVGVLMAALDSSIVNIALPTIATSLNVTPSSVIWVANGYQVASAAAMLICASLGVRLGERRFYTSGMVLFTLSSLGCGLSSNFDVLVAMRVLQGLSYAMMISVGLGLYRVIFPPSSLGTVFGLNALAFAVGTAAGPAIGGIIITHLSWPWLFYINIPLGGLAVYFCFTALGTDTYTEKGFDATGAVTSATALGLLVLAVDEIGRWTESCVMLLLGLSLVLFTVFLFAQRKSDHPLLPMDIFYSRRYSFAVISSVTMFISQGMALVALPFVLQHTYRYTTLESALIFTPWPVAVAICAPIAGSLTGRFHATRISTIGVLIFCLGLGSLIFLPAGAAVGDFVWRVAVCGIGYGFFLPPNNKEMFANVSKHRAVTASGVLSTARTAGQSIGAALVAMIIGLLGGLTGSSANQFTLDVFGLAFVIAAFSVIASMLRVHR